MWPIFRSASSQVRLQGEKIKKEEESVVKYECADTYVGRSNNRKDYVNAAVSQLSYTLLLILSGQACN